MSACSIELRDGAEDVEEHPPDGGEVSMLWSSTTKVDASVVDRGF